jgi:tetratricopeptide (TPR) repeat protein
MLALELLEQSYQLKAKNLPADNALLETAHRELVLTINSCAMKALSEDKFDVCLDLLRKSEHYTADKKYASLRVLTFNNLGCYYRRLGKLKSAYKQLKAAVQLGAESKSGEHLAVTHLNMCAILSQKGQHEKALENAQVAVYHAQEELVSAKLKKQGATASGTPEEQMLTLAMAYHNMAVELEFVGKYQLCLQWYKKAMQLVAEHKDTQQAMYDNFRKSYVEVRKKVQGGVLVEKEGAGGATKKSDKKQRSHFLAAQLNHFSRRDEYEAELFKKLHSSSGQTHKAYNADTDTRKWNTDVRTNTDPDDPRYFESERDEEDGGVDQQDRGGGGSDRQRVGCRGEGGRVPPRHGGLQTQSEYIPSTRQRRGDGDFGGVGDGKQRRQRPNSAHANLTRGARDDKRRQESGQERQHQPRQADSGTTSRRPVSARDARESGREKGRSGDRVGQRRQRPTNARPASARPASARDPVGSDRDGARAGRGGAGQREAGRGGAGQREAGQRQRPTSASTIARSDRERDRTRDLGEGRSARGSGHRAGEREGGARLQRPISASTMHRAKGSFGKVTGGGGYGEGDVVRKTGRRSDGEDVEEEYESEDYGGEYKENYAGQRGDEGKRGDAGQRGGYDEQKDYEERDFEEKRFGEGIQEGHQEECKNGEGATEEQKLRYLEQLERANREAQEALEFLMKAGAAPEHSAA